ncbi:MAG TPA: hypothetical protein DCS07_02835 [Bdellovibrionales bacterium]|nr:MAG: hypothetical protein A2Z97_10950 [Bdellovibrionales bacterium GWB1_52_6]OFZ03523.1 MAG: hypothetical protein A2X97_06140 [Bdellovibrionales bacterium GWA1_52_35]OFZ33517.1 MAG: hypothetical protein A2070_08375 [Bdellovibrionales bacterium GWC1_52_8]HAR41558.1 hypothetical protein [Bdellovibrionales bacterium]HCM41110.1 hypothetical protein [Bdellovibrionales bacterium]
MQRRTLSILLAVVLATVLFALIRGSGPRQSPTSPGEDADTSTVLAPAVPATPSPGNSAVPVLPSSTESATPVAYSPEDGQKVTLLKEILKSKNDNDPRLDRELRVLSEGAKNLMVQQYRAFEAEKRNERGTIVFLLGRNLRAEPDFSFLCEVLREPPCLSLKNCSGDPSTVGREDFEHESGEEITLAYPQIVALVALQDYLLAGSTTPTGRFSALKALECAKDSKVPAVQAKAAQVKSTSEHSSGS